MKRDRRAPGHPGTAPKDGPGLWTARQAAEFLGVDESTIRKWARVGELPHMRLGWSPHRKTIRFDPDSLAVYVNSRYVDAR